jgi:biotin carboxyl carrier protein
VKYYARVGDRTHECTIETEEGETFVRVDGRRYRVDLQHIAASDSYSLLVDGRSFEFALHAGPDSIDLSGAAGLFHVEVEDDRTRAARSKAGRAAPASGPRTVRSVMPGIVREVLARTGEKVEKGQPLLILEAMKMQNEVRADHAAEVGAIHVAAGVTVDKGAPLLDLK